MVHNIANVLNVTELYVHSKVVKMLNFMLCVFNHTHTHKKQAEFPRWFLEGDGAQRAAVPAWPAALTGSSVGTFTGRTEKRVMRGHWPANQ